MRHPPRAGIAARIAHEPDAAQDAVTIEQHRENDRMPGDARAHAAERHRIVDGPADIFALVVEADIDLMQAIVLGPALAELRPVGETLTRRTAIAAAGELAVTVGAHRFRVEAEPQTANLTLVVARLRQRRQACERERE